MNILDKSYKTNIDKLKNKVTTGQTESINWRIKQINTLRTQIMSSTKAFNRRHPGNNRGRVTLNSMQKEEVKKQRKRDNFFNSQINTEEEARHLTVLKEYHSTFAGVLEKY